MTTSKKIDIQLGKKIKTIRESHHITQKQLAKKLHLKRTTISAIENGKRQLKASELKQLAEIFNISVDSLLNLKKPPEVILEEIESNQEQREQNRIRINVPVGNIVKFKEVLLYILTKVGAKPNIGETVLYKLLYFIDFDYYEKYEEQMIGAKYMKNHYGPTPVEFKKIVDNMINDRELKKIEGEHFGYPQTQYLPLRQPDITIFKGSEIEMINNVLKKLSDKNATQLSDYSHEDVPWIAADDGDIIEYEAVFYRTPQYSVRDE